MDRIETLMVVLPGNTVDGLVARGSELSPEGVLAMAGEPEGGGEIPQYWTGVYKCIGAGFPSGPGSVRRRRLRHRAGRTPG